MPDKTNTQYMPWSIPS